jgi:translation initiation factor 2-alpha kinase 4
MSPKQRKKPSREKKQTSSTESSLTSPAIPTTNYREIHQTEAEALQSIYGDDYEEVQLRRSAWQVCIEVFDLWLYVTDFGT